MENVDVRTRKVIFFDGVCHLCNGFVDAVIQRDKAHLYLFAPLQGTTAKGLLSTQERENIDTVIYFEAGTTYHRSTAILKVLTGLGGAFKIFALVMMIPAPLRDTLYNFIAKNRYAWFGKRDFCRIPTSQERSYLLP